MTTPFVIVNSGNAQAPNIIPKGHEKDALLHVSQEAFDFAADLRLQKLNPLPPICFFVSPDWDINAFAEVTLRENRVDAYRVALTTGLILNVLLVGTILLTDPMIEMDVSPGLTPEDLTDEWIHNIDWRGNVVQHLPEFERRCPVDTLPESRMAWMINAAVYAVRFTLLHELAHVWCGHLDWCKRHRTRHRLQQNGPHRGVDGETVNALEYQADACALDMLFRGSLHNTTAARQAGFGVAVFLSLLGNGYGDVDAYANGHPHPGARSVLARLVHLPRRDRISPQLLDAWGSSYDQALLALLNSGIIGPQTRACFRYGDRAFMEQVIAQMRRAVEIQERVARDVQENGWPLTVIG